MQRKESSYITLEKYAYAVLIRASLYQFHMYQRCSQPVRHLSKVTSIITLSRFNRKHLPIQHHNFLKTKQNEIHRSRKVGGKVKTALVLVLPLCHLYNYNLRFYIYIYIYISLYAIAFHSYMSSRSDYTQQG